MKVKLSCGRESDLSVMYSYDDNGHPVGVFVDLFHPDGFYLCGESSVKPPDQFSYLKGRKYALTSMFRRDDAGSFGPEKILSKEDRRTLFEAVCPKYFGKQKVKNLECGENLSEKELKLIGQIFKETVTFNNAIATVPGSFSRLLIPILKKIKLLRQ